MINKKHIYAVILAGGVGSRFWPLSRELEPKQFLKLYNNQSLLQQTIKRILSIVNLSKIYIVANRLHKFELEEQISVFGISKDNIIFEPSGKNTAGAIALSAKIIARDNPEAIIIVLPSDHAVKMTGKFTKLVKSALRAAGNNFLVTLGIKPKSPSTGYGYIKKGDKIAGLKNTYQVGEFKEKPDPQLARKFLKTGRYFWNSGMFIWKAGIILAEIRKFLPDLYGCIETLDQKNIFEHKWTKLSPISIDYGVLEKSNSSVIVTAGNIGWSDLGSWLAIDELYQKNSQGNLIQANCIDLGSKNVTVFGDNKLISTIALRDLIIVDTNDAILICNKDKTEDVKKMVELVKKSGGSEHFSHLKVKRPWGNYLVISHGRGFKVKLIEVMPHKRLSLQRHKFRSEHWVVVEGVARVTCGKKVSFIHSNESIFVSAKQLHRLENPKDKILKIVEVQSGSCLEEDDIERVNDDFRRLES
ncbi:MAG: mannose-1-phosphate guanylyltransferase/mannose-6-phosphate isomerase [Candidatus Omnitrophota bacterium]